MEDLNRMYEEAMKWEPGHVPAPPPLVSDLLNKAQGDQLRTIPNQ